MFPLRVTAHLSSLSYMEIIYHVILWLVPKGATWQKAQTSPRCIIGNAIVFFVHVMPSPAVTLGSHVFVHDSWKTSACSALQVSRLHSGRFWKFPLFTQIWWGKNAAKKFHMKMLQMFRFIHHMSTWWFLGQISQKNVSLNEFYISLINKSDL